MLKIRAGRPKGRWKIKVPKKSRAQKKDAVEGVSLWLNRAHRTDCVIRNRPVLMRKFKLEDWM
jgi:hypothetical protein